MAQRQANSGSISDIGWLLTLVDTFERTEQLCDVPCDEKLLSAARARLETCQRSGQQLRARKKHFQPQH